jgi:NDP-sugar pyrophosphorylase family protein
MNKSHAFAFFDLANYPHKELFQSISFVWEALSQIKPYLAAFPLGYNEGKLAENVFLENKEQISIGTGTIVESGAFIRGPCIIGKNCVIRHGAYIRGHVITGDSCVIGHDTEVKNSIFFNDSHAAHFAYVGDSILGNGVNLGAGTICANLKLDRTDIYIDIEGERFETGLRKLGAILGDAAQTGCNSVLSPGTLFGKSACCYPCMHVLGFIPENHIVKNAEQQILRKRSDK